MVGCPSAVGPQCAAAGHRPILCSLPPSNFRQLRQNNKARKRWPAGISARLGGNDSDPLLQAALSAASLRFQETLRPDPLFLDKFAGCFFSPNNSPNDVEEHHLAVPINASPPCHYNLATKFIDDKLLSLMSSNEDLRQAVWIHARIG